MEVEQKASMKKENLENVPVTVYRIIGVPSNIQGLNNTTIQIVPKLEEDDELDTLGDSEKQENVTYASFVIEEEPDSSDHKQSTPQVIWTTKQEKSDLYPLTCTMCPKRFKHHSHLKRHINTHTGEKVYRCDTCNKTFLDASTLSRHRRIHSGDKPWSCKMCQKCFGTLGSLRRHVTIHNQEGRPFQCDICLKRFPDNSSFQKHRFIHTGIKPHTCEQCGKAFVHIGDLNGHRKIHVKVKPYNCEHCRKDFAKYSNYARHLLIHEGEREYTCTLCGVSYNYQSSLTRHLLTHVHRGNKALLEATKNAAGDQGTDINTSLSGDDLFILPDDPSMISKHIKVKRTRMKHRMIEHLKKTCMKTNSEVAKETLKTEAISKDPVTDKSKEEVSSHSEKVTPTSLVDVLKSNGIEVPESASVVILSNASPEVLNGAVVLSVDSSRQEQCDPTVLPPEDETVSRLSTTEDVQLLLYSAENFGSTKDFSEPLLPPPVSSSSEPLLALLSHPIEGIAEIEVSHEPLSITNDAVPSTSKAFDCSFQVPVSDSELATETHNVQLSVEPSTGKVLATLANVSDPEYMLPLNA